MPPVMNRKASNKRCEQAWELRCSGRTWSEVAREVGYNSPQAALKAVKSWLEKNPPDELETMRRASGDMLTRGIDKLFKAMEVAERRGELRTLAELVKVAFDGIDKRAKLRGEWVAVPTQVDVTVVQTMTEILTDTKARLLDAIDAEIVALPEVDQP